MRTITVSKDGRVIAVDREGDDDTTGDAVFLRAVQERLDASTEYDPDPVAKAMREAAAAIGATVTQEGELEPIPDGAVA